MVLVVTICSWILMPKLRRICDDKFYSISVSDINIMIYSTFPFLYTVEVRSSNPLSSTTSKPARMSLQAFSISTKISCSQDLIALACHGDSRYTLDYCKCDVI